MMPDPFKTPSINRRELLLSGAALAIGLAHSPARIWAAVTAAEAASAPSLDLLTELCAAVIPDTDTPGAVAAGVPAFVVTAAEHGLEGAPPDLLQRFGTALDAFAGGPYLSLEPERRNALLTDIDARAFSRPAANPLPADLQHWTKLKGLIVIGYYTSEIGGSQELRFIQIPGRFDPDIPYEPGDRALSSDWVAVKYG
jgi:hypothetical protein